MGRDEVLALLRRHGGSVSLAAREARVTRQTVWNYLVRLELRAETRAMRERPPRVVVAAEGRRYVSRALDVEGGRFTEEQAARALVERHSGHLTRVAEEIGISRMHLYRLLDRLGLREFARQTRRRARSTYDF
jgi:transcriptional regulator of acetoin/glycerol metabolism